MGIVVGRKGTVEGCHTAGLSQIGLNPERHRVPKVIGHSCLRSTCLRERGKGGKGKTGLNFPPPALIPEPCANTPLTHEC